MLNQSQRFASSYFHQQILCSVNRITAIVIPASPSDVLLLPEGERHLPSLKIFTTTLLTRGEIIHFHGEDYVLKTLSNWSDYGYYHHLAVKHLPTAKSDSTGFEIT